MAEARTSTESTEPSAMIDPDADGTPGAVGRPGDGPSGRSVLAGWGQTRTALVLAVIALSLLLVGATAGMALRGSSAAPAGGIAVPSTDSVDAGFSRDMIVHHTQGTLMAYYAEQHTTDDEIAVMAYDIDATQTAQIGQMQGWLALWQLPQVTGEPAMGWMTSGSHAGMDMGTFVPTDPSAPMPGMATAAEMATLQSLRGEASDVMFLQLMIRHHQGGAAMMEDGAAHASSPVVRNFAAQMLQAQTSEIAVMTQMLAQRGASPLPAP
ncbi:DUF305 domain-containing protein [Nakamurella flavida]|uniref:DUF305 domain-containing protein n=1 Tax=Nakamurella flavida TaxID=363630 RepID=A0A938YK59_9ACTN|nr:DUF305 domain-containing protein [Nakamurella flavida]MBM9474927.1 DUF305 domain-containing protein [Nakamurella flavida]MDP9776496.1 uncharacterized protein (DUF305 family) [Nakamurella flavida]